MPNGRHYTGVDEKYAPVHLLSEIGKTATVDANGAVAWTGYSVMQLMVALQPAFVVLSPNGNELNQTDAWQIVWKTIVALIKSRPDKSINPSDLLKKADEEASEFFRIPSNNYVLVSSLSVTDLPAKRIKVRRCIISSMKQRSKKFPFPESYSLQSHGPFCQHINSTEYRSVKVSTQGRTVHEATNNALNALNVLRGLWNLFATYGSWSISFGSVTRKPIGVIHAGPIHTLHHPNGKLVDDNLYWYDPEFQGEQPIFSKNEIWVEIEKKRKMAMRRIAALEYGAELESLLIRYAAALDQPDADLAFLQMWGILEGITGTVGGNYDQTIRRTLWVFASEKRNLAKDILESLRCHRNRYVHSGKTGEESSQVAYMIKAFVDPHLINLIINTFKVRSLEDYGECLALPPDISSLEQKLRKFSDAIRVLKKATN